MQLAVVITSLKLLHIYKQFCSPEPLCTKYKAAYICMTDPQTVPAYLVQSGLPISRFDPYTITYAVHKNMRALKCQRVTLCLAHEHSKSSS